MVTICLVVVTITLVAVALNRWSKRYIQKLSDIRGDFGEITRLSRECHKDSLRKGFYNKPQELGTSLMLVVSELSEALEADRVGRYAKLDTFKRRLQEEGEENFKEIFENEVKDTVEDELTDTLIRILDLSGKMDIDIGSHLALKIRYNQLRPYKNGKEY